MTQSRMNFHFILNIQRSRIQSYLEMQPNKPSQAVMALLLSTIILLVVHLQVIKSHQAPSEYHSSHYNPYSFGYDVEDNYGNKQWRQEKSHNPMEVHGSYGYRDNTGVYREVVYVADKNGFRANIKTNELGVSGTKNPASVKVESYPAPTYSSQATHARYTPSGPSYYSSQPMPSH